MTFYIMTPHLFSQLCQVHGFNDVNGKNYQEHVLIIGGDKVPSTLHEKIRNAVDAKAALEVLKENNIDYTHKHNSQRY